MVACIVKMRKPPNMRIMSCDREAGRLSCRWYTKNFGCRGKDGVSPSIYADSRILANRPVCAGEARFDCRKSNSGDDHDGKYLLVAVPRIGAKAEIFLVSYSSQL